MSNIQPVDEGDVDRIEETVTTRQPGYAATEQVITDVAAERRQGLFQITRIMWTAWGILEILLGLRLLLKLIGANPVSGFAWFIYGITGLFVEPFVDLVPNWSSGETIFEVTTIIAIGVYALAYWGVVRLTRIIADRPTSRSVTRSTIEETPGSGTKRVTHSTRND